MQFQYENIVRKFLYIWLGFSVIFFTFLIPPFQKPDEINHFLRATALAKGEFLCQQHIGNGYFTTPYNFYNVSDQMSANVIKYRYNEKFPLHELVAQQSSNTRAVKVTGLCLLPFTGYVSNDIGLSIGLLFNNPLLAFYLARLSAGIIFVLAIILSIKLIPTKYRLIVYTYACIPMIMHQVTAVSYDTMQLSLGILLFSLLLRYLTLPKLTKGQLALFIIILGGYAITKPGYFPLLFLYFVIPYKKITTRFSRYLISTALVAIPIGILMIIAAKTVTAPIPGNALINPQLQIAYLMQNPLAPLHIVFSSLQHAGDFYYQSFIGDFGWLDFRMNYFVYEAYTILFTGVFFVLLKNTTVPLMNKRQILLLMSIILGMVILIFTSQYLGWSPVASYIINGIQGRYFLVLFPFAFFAIIEFALLLGRKNFIILIAALFFAFLMLDLLFNVYNRYYNYTNIYMNEHPFKKIIKTLPKQPQTQIIAIKKRTTFRLVNQHMDKTIDGFTIVFQTSSKKFSTPYEYTIKDAQCNHTLKHSFFDLNKLQNKTVPSAYEEKFTSPIEKGNDTLCLIVEPFTQHAPESYLSFIALKQKILFEPLFNR